MTELQISKHSLRNGLKVVLIDLPQFHSLTNFLSIRSGSRYEEPSNNGVAHFLEHLVFKGTAKYSDTLKIAQAIEGVGGYFNAWTANDHTCYWNTVPQSRWEVGLEMPIELAFKALLREEDIERERGVILEEIRMIQDDPRHFVDDLFGQTLFHNHPLGQFIIGNEQTIKKMTHQNFLDYRRSHYHVGQAVFVVIGPVNEKQTLARLEELTASEVAGPVSSPEPFRGLSRRNLTVKNKTTDQTHFMLGVASPDLAINKKERWAVIVLNTVLGRGMSSRLFLNVREKRGLAYAINSTYQPFEDTGLVGIYGGVNTEKISEALEAVGEELERLQQEKVGEEEISRAKELIKGSYDLSSDDPVQLARWYGTSMLLGMKESFSEAKLLIEEVDASAVLAAAKKLFDKQNLAMAVVGPYQDDRIFRDFLGLQKAS